MNGVTHNSSRVVHTLPSIDSGTYEQLSLNYDENQNALWLFMHSKPRPCFTPALIQEIQQVFSKIRQHDENTSPVDYFVAASTVPGIYNLGGDLHYFQECIEQQDKERLRDYGHSCLDIGYQCSTQFGRNVITIALVQGQAMGGGLEAALACNVIIAEESATFGFPEILFNLFPGMGAHIFLSRRVAPYVAQRMITSGNKYSAKEMYDMGIVDVLVKDGEGTNATAQYIKRHRSRLLAQRAILQANYRLNPVSMQELQDINDLWVDISMQIKPQDIRTMERLIRAQGKAAKSDVRS